MDLRKLTAFAAAVLMTVSLAACGDSSSSKAANESKAESAAAESAVSAAEGSKDEQSAPSSEELARSGEVRDIPAADIVAEMTTGWNLGNTLDATSGTGVDTETGWGNPRVTKEMIDGIKAKGFDIIRIPVTWGNHVDASYSIDEAWLNRVQEIVNYAYDDGMYVIINSHHEEDWRIPDNAHIDESDKENARIWQQVAERFKDYGDHLVFEGLNEPRVKGSPEEWNGGTEEGRRCVDRMNKTFVDTVRATGGNNQNRLLLLTTYASSCVSKATKDVAMIEDKHLGFSIHAYTPYAFTYAPGESWELFTWDGSHDSEVRNMLYELKQRFVDAGYPVIITEYGAVNKNSNDAEVAKWATYYVSTAKKCGIPCVWWDNGYYFSGNELFGIYDRSNYTWFSDVVADAIIKAAAE